MVTVSLLQIASPDAETPAERISRVRDLIVAQRGAHLIVLPELWSAGYFSFDEYERHAEGCDGPTVTMVRETARELGCAIHLGSFVERGRAGELHNTAALVDKTGRVSQIYRKIHVFGYQSKESQLLTPGDTLSVVPSVVGPVASTTCYDLRFPGLWHELSERGAETVVVPAAWPAARREHWRLLTQARAVEHQAWIIAVNACGTQGDVTLGGYSRVVAPTGEVIAEAGADEAVIQVDLDPDLVTRTRQEFPVIADRLADYSTISHEAGAES